MTSLVNWVKGQDSTEDFPIDRILVDLLKRVWFRVSPQTPAICYPPCLCYLHHYATRIILLILIPSHVLTAAKPVFLATLRHINGTKSIQQL